VVFTCHSESQVRWTFNKHRLPANAKLSNGDYEFQYMLKLDELKLQNSGIYACFGTFDGIKFRSSASLKVIGM